MATQGLAQGEKDLSCAFSLRNRTGTPDTYLSLSYNVLCLTLEKEVNRLKPKLFFFFFFALSFQRYFVLDKGILRYSRTQQEASSLPEH